MLNENFIVLGTFIAAIGTVIYTIDTLKGKVKPNRLSFFLWTLAPLIAFAAQIKQGVGIYSLVTFWAGFAPIPILIASFFNKKAQWKLETFDFICGGLSLLGLFLWYITGVGNLAISFGIASDALAGLPIVIKAYKYPETENGWLFFLGAINALITLLALKNWSFAYSAFPIYTFLITCIIFFFAEVKPKLKSV